VSPPAHAFCGLVPAVSCLCGLCFAALATETIAYHVEAGKPLSRFTSGQLALLAKLNHADSGHLPRLQYVVVPDRWDPDELVFSPMPLVAANVACEKKAIIVDLAAQVFGAYELGKLVRWGPVSSGDRRHETRPGTYHLNWHARVHISREHSDWVMPWYFNFSSNKGLGLHQYALPGRPASHGCVRMLAVDAKWLYDWGDGWQLADDSHDVVQEGTLVLLSGSYDFAAPPPWMQPEWWVRGVTLPALQMADAK
jgi:hypothetical protein